MRCCCRTATVRANSGPQCRVKERRVARPPRTGGRHHGLAAMAGCSSPGSARDRISLMGWANGASALLWAVRPQSALAQGRAGFPLGDRVLSGLPDLVRPRMERAGADAAADRRQGRHQFAVGLPPDGRRRARPQRAGADRGLSRRLSRFRPRQSAAAGDRRRRRSRRCRNAAISAPIAGRAQRIAQSASRNGWRGEAALLLTSAGLATAQLSIRPAWPRASAPRFGSLRRRLSATRRRAADPHPRWRRRGRRRIRC